MLRTFLVPFYQRQRYCVPEEYRQNKPNEGSESHDIQRPAERQRPIGIVQPQKQDGHGRRPDNLNKDYMPDEGVASPF